MPPVSCWRTGRWTWAASSARNQDLCHKALCHFYACAMLDLNKPQTWGPEGWYWVSPHWVLVQEATKHSSHAQALLVDVAQGPLELLWAGNLPKGLQPQWGKLNCYTQCFSIQLQMKQLQWAFSNSLASPKFSGLSLVDFLPWAQLHGSPVPWVPNLRQVYGSGPAGVGTCHMRRWSGTNILQGLRVSPDASEGLLNPAFPFFKRHPLSRTGATANQDGNLSQPKPIEQLIGWWNGC